MHVGLSGNNTWYKIQSANKGLYVHVHKSYSQEYPPLINNFWMKKEKFT